jgi:hypothetical protein
MARQWLRTRGAVLSITLSVWLYPAYAQSHASPSASTLEDPRIDVSGENPVYAKRRIFLSYDWQDLEDGKALNRVRLRMLRPFGADARYSWQVELPYERLQETNGDVIQGVSDIATRLNWAVSRTPELRQNLGLNIQWQTAQDRRLSDNATLVMPQYAFSHARSDTFVISAQLIYARSVDRALGAPRVNRLSFEPSMTLLLPDSWSCNLATRMSWNFERNKLAATVRGTLGFVVGQRQQWEFDAFAEHALTDFARQTQFEKRVGFDLVRYF